MRFGTVVPLVTARALSAREFTYELPEGVGKGAVVSVPFVEVHVTNVYAREPERRHSMLAPAARCGVVGLGVYGYELALRGLVAKLKDRSA